MASLWVAMGSDPSSMLQTVNWVTMDVTGGQVVDCVNLGASRFSGKDRSLQCAWIMVIVNCSSKASS